MAFHFTTLLEINHLACDSHLSSLWNLIQNPSMTPVVLTNQ